MLLLSVWRIYTYICIYYKIYHIIIIIIKQYFYYSNIIIIKYSIIRHLTFRMWYKYVKICFFYTQYIFISSKIFWLDLNSTIIYYLIIICKNLFEFRLIILRRVFIYFLLNSFSKKNLLALHSYLIKYFIKPFF